MKSGISTLLQMKYENNSYRNLWIFLLKVLHTLNVQNYLRLKVICLTPYSQTKFITIRCIQFNMFYIKENPKIEVNREIDDHLKY